MRLNLLMIRKMDRRHGRLILTRLLLTTKRSITPTNIKTVRTLLDMKIILQNELKKNPTKMTLRLALAIQKHDPYISRIPLTMTLYPKITQHPNLNNNNQHHHSSKSKYLAHKHTITMLSFIILSIPLGRAITEGP